MIAPTKLLLAGSLTIALACGQDEPAPAPPDPKSLTAALLRTADEVVPQVEKLRGYAFKRKVDKAVYTKEQLREYLAAMLRKEYGGGKLERTEAWLGSMGLLGGGRGLAETMTDVLLSQIGGFYDPDKQSFFMMAETSVYGDTINRMMIAHELCHALDDQYVDLRSMLHPEGRELTEDESYVVGGIVEGSATALMSAWMADAVRQGATLAELAKVAEQQKDQMEVLLSAPPYCTLLVANYIVGMNFVTRGKGPAATAAGDSGAAILEIAKAMPRSSEQLLHPEKYWDAGQRDEPVRLQNVQAVAELVSAHTGLVVIETNVLGELVAALAASPQKRRLNAALMARADYWTNRAARGWGGDHSFVLGKTAARAGAPVQAPGVVWVTAWDTETDREEFVTAVRRHRGQEPGLLLAEGGKVAVLAFGSARDLGAAGLEAVLAAARFEQDGAVWPR